jgi:hypothetical protein
MVFLFSVSFFLNVLVFMISPDYFIFVFLDFAIPNKFKCNTPMFSIRGKRSINKKNMQGFFAFLITNSAKIQISNSLPWILDTWIWIGFWNKYNRNHKALQGLVSALKRHTPMLRRSPFHHPLAGVTGFTG